MTKTKSEPRKPKPAPGNKPLESEPVGVPEGEASPSTSLPVQAAPAADAAGNGAAKKGAAKKGRAVKAASAKKAAPAKQDRLAKGSAGADVASRGGDDGEDDGEQEDREERSGDEDERDDRDDVEVVEVVGEVVGEVVDEGDGNEREGVDVDVGELPAFPSGGSNEAALSRSDPLQAYLREVQRHALLTPDEEKELTQRYVKTQDVRTAARLVTSNLRLVVKLAYEYRRAYKNIMDLIQEGNIGLMQAVKRYDPYRGVKLSSYAAWWIRAYILRFILNNWRLVKLGTTQAQRKLFFNLNKEKAKLAALGIEPTAAEIALRLHVEEKEVVEMDRRLSSGEASLDAPVGDTDGRAVSRLEMMPSLSGGPDVALEAREMGELVHDRLSRFRSTLKGKDVIIFDKRMRAEDPLTLQELGDEFGISRERVRQLEARLTMKLRVYLKEELGDAVGTG